MKTQIVMAIIIVVLFALENVFVYQTGKNSVKAQIIRDTDTVITYRTIQDIQVIPKYTTIYKTDSVKTTDTLFVFDTSYVATLDTTYEDDTAKLKVDFVSPIPLSPKSYFNLDLDVKKELVFVPTYVKDESFWHNRFIVYLGGGVSYGIDSKTIEPALQVGLGIRIN